MGGLILRRWLPAVLVAGCVAMFAGRAAATLDRYTLVAVPDTVVADTVVDYSMTLDNVGASDKIGCVQLDLPAEYEVYSVGELAASNVATWLSAIDGNAVVVHAADDGGRLRVGESLSFVITARAKQDGVMVWDSHAHADDDCESPDEQGPSVVITVQPPDPPDASSSPSSTPAPSATPKPTPKPTPRPTPRPSQHARPSEPPRPTASPTPTPTPTPAATPTPEPIIDRGYTFMADPPDRGEGSGTGRGDGGVPSRAMIVTAGDDAAMASLGLASLATHLGSTAFLVPAAVLGGPGLVLIAWVVLQALGVASWIPAVRRLRGKDEMTG